MRSVERHVLYEAVQRLTKSCLDPKNTNLKLICLKLGAKIDLRNVAGTFDPLKEYKIFGTCGPGPNRRSERQCF